MLLLGAAAIALLFAWFFASAHLTGVEPKGLFVDCGPALVGRPSPVPDPSCTDEYGFVVLLSVLFGLAGVASLIGGVWLVLRAATRQPPVG